jgi:glycosyltransferase involved in cell wall biosynthesis
MKLSVIIPCFNCAGTVGTQLEALMQQQWTEPWEVILANNRSTDRSVTVAEQYMNRLPNLRIVDASERQGQPFALNTGARAARGESLAFCDADDEVGSGWLMAMGEALQRHNFVACRFGVEKLNPSWTQRARGRTQTEGLQKIWYPPYLPHAGGGSLGVKRSLFEAIGGFDESLPILHDTDFCFRAQLAGTELQFVPDAVVHVRYRNTMGGLYRQSRSYAEYNILLAKRYQPEDTQNLQLWKQYLGDWLRLVKQLTRLYSKEGQGRVMWLLGRQIGRLRASLRCWAPPV